MKIFEIYEEMMDEDYPSSWNLETFKSLRSFAQRIKYCEEHLQRISSGTARIVYKVDDEKVLKLAKNQKGVAQNEIEAAYSQYNDIKDILAIVFDSDDNNLWIEMELAYKLTAPLFEKIVGFNFKDFIAALHNHYNRVNPAKSTYNADVPEKLVAQMWENEFCYDMFSFIGNYDVPVGDLKRFNSYGVVKRNGGEQVVMIDYGLDNSVYDSYYK